MDIDTFFYVFGLIVAAVLGVLAIRVVATFDINKWQERRDQKMIVRLQNACPHVSVARGEGKVSVTPLIVTTAGTLDWFCTRCKLVFPGGLLLPPVPNEPVGIKMAEERERSYARLVRKAGYV